MPFYRVFRKLDPALYDELKHVYALNPDDARSALEHRGVQGEIELVREEHIFRLVLA